MKYLQYYVSLPSGISSLLLVGDKSQSWFHACFSTFTMYCYSAFRSQGRWEPGGSEVPTLAPPHPSVTPSGLPGSTAMWCCILWWLGETGLLGVPTSHKKFHTIWNCYYLVSFYCYRYSGNGTINQIPHPKPCYQSERGKFRAVIRSWDLRNSLGF